MKPLYEILMRDGGNRRQPEDTKSIGRKPHGYSYAFRFYDRTTSFEATHVEVFIRGDKPYVENSALEQSCRLAYSAIVREIINTKKRKKFIKDKRPSVKIRVG